MTEPIFFWQNSDLFKKRTFFLAQKLAKLEHLLENLPKFHQKSTEISNKNILDGFDSHQGTEDHPIY